MKGLVNFLVVPLLFGLIVIAACSATTRHGEMQRVVHTRSQGTTVSVDTKHPASSSVHATQSSTSSHGRFTLATLPLGVMPPLYSFQNISNHASDSGIVTEADAVAKVRLLLCPHMPTTIATLGYYSDANLISRQDGSSSAGLLDHVLTWEIRLPKNAPASCLSSSICPKLSRATGSTVFPDTTLLTCEFPDVDVIVDAHYGEILRVVPAL